MPELPEVESVVRRVGPQVAGRPIRSLKTTWPKALIGRSARTASRLLRGQTITSAGRRGKYFHFRLRDDLWLVGHLRMSGNLYVTPDARPQDRWIRHRLCFEDGGELQFTDARKFGQLWLAEDLTPIYGKLGPEPLDPNWSAKQLRRALHGRRRLLKPLLLDQGFLAGLGNIYVDESLNRARLHPLRRSDELELEECRRLYRAIRSTLRAAIRHCGTSFDRALVTAEGAPQGEFQAYLRAYGRKGEPCRNCRQPIEKGVVGQRGTYWCPGCQLENCK